MQTEVSTGFFFLFEASPSEQAKPQHARSPTAALPQHKRSTSAALQLICERSTTALQRSPTDVVKRIVQGADRLVVGHHVRRDTVITAAIMRDLSVGMAALLEPKWLRTNTISTLSLCAAAGVFVRRLFV